MISDSINEFVDKMYDKSTPLEFTLTIGIMLMGFIFVFLMLFAGLGLEKLDNVKVENLCYISGGLMLLFLMLLVVLKYNKKEVENGRIQENN